MKYIITLTKTIEAESLSKEKWGKRKRLDQAEQFRSAMLIREIFTAKEWLKTA